MSGCLNARKVEAAGPGKYEDGNGLRLAVTKRKAKSWVFRFTFAGKRREMGLGSYSHWSVLPDDKEPQKVGILEVRAAIGWIEQYFKPTIHNIFGATGKPEQAAQLLAKAIIDKRSQTIMATDIRLNWKIPELKTANPVMEAVQILIDLDWLEWTDPDHTKGGSRKREWTVNPQVFRVTSHSTASTAPEKQG